jgi:opacity protein-like surface antigen
MRTRLTAAALATILAAFPVHVLADDPNEGATNLQLLGGFKALNDNDWKPAEEQTGFGVQFDVQPDDWKFAFALGLIASESSSQESDIPTIGKVSSESRTTALNIGVRKYIDADKLRPFLGVGLTFVRAELETSSAAGSNSDSGTGVGPWAGIGLLYMVSDWLGLGGQVQYSTAQAEVFGEDLDAGGVEADALINFHF